MATSSNLVFILNIQKYTLQKGLFIVIVTLSSAKKSLRVALARVCVGG